MWTVSLLAVVLTTFADAPNRVQDARQFAQLTVDGRALDPSGAPIADARILLFTSRPRASKVAETLTDEEGRFRFANQRVGLTPGEDPESLSGASSTFEVYGVAADFGFTWSGARVWYPHGPRFRNRGHVPGVYFELDPIEIDLTFRPAVSLDGRVVTTDGKPIPGARVGIWHAEPVPEFGYDSANAFRVVGAQATEVMYVESVIPGSIRNRRTDANGRFEFSQMPPDSEFRLRIRAEGFGTRMLSATTAPADRFRFKSPIVHRAGMTIAFRKPVSVPVQVSFDDTGRPAPNVYVHAGNDESSDSGVTDASGQVELRLPPGEHRLSAIVEDGTRYLSVRNVSLTVGEEPGAPTIVRLRPSAELFIEAFDAATGVGVAGVQLWTRQGEETRDHWVQTFQPPNLSHVKYSRTDRQGRLRASFEPGEYLIGFWPSLSGYRMVEPGVRVVCESGKRTRLRIRMKKQ